MILARDVVSSIIFYTGMVLVSVLLIRLGTTYGWEKVDDQFRHMEPRLTRGAHAWINKRIRTPEELNYGDIIMYRRPLWKRGASTYEFARVVGKPGDEVKVEGRSLYRAERTQGELGPMKPITEHYIKNPRKPTEFSAFIVPRNSVFVLYDDRAREDPLRDFIVPVRAIRGKVIY
jgi:signal peptidase I